MFKAKTLTEWKEKEIFGKEGKENVKAYAIIPQ